MNKGNKMYDYLLNHNYISENKKSNYQSELSVERAECIANKSNSLVEEENANLKQALNEIRESCEDNAIDVNTREYGNLVVTNIDDILQTIDKVLGGSDEY